MIAQTNNVCLTVQCATLVERATFYWQCGNFRGNTPFNRGEKAEAIAFYFNTTFTTNIQEAFQQHKHLNRFSYGILLRNYSHYCNPWGGNAHGFRLYLVWRVYTKI
jgi:hypothetical protein